MEVVLATKNKNKIQEIYELVQDIEGITFITLEDISFNQEIEEDSSTYKENATKKARVVYEYTKKVTIAEDSGLEIKALRGEPGVHSKRYFGEITEIERNKKMLEILKDMPSEKREARYRCTVALFISSNEYYIFEGCCKGIITTVPLGNNGFGYDPIFMLPRLNKTMAELDTKSKNMLSHRGKAFRKVKRFLESRTM